MGVHMRQVKNRKARKTYSEAEASAFAKAVNEASKPRYSDEKSKQQRMDENEEE